MVRMVFGGSGVGGTRSSMWQSWTWDVRLDGFLFVGERISSWFGVYTANDSREASWSKGANEFQVRRLMLGSMFTDTTAENATRIFVLFILRQHSTTFGDKGVTSYLSNCSTTLKIIYLNCCYQKNVVIITLSRKRKCSGHVSKPLIDSNSTQHKLLKQWQCICECNRIPPSIPNREVRIKYDQEIFEYFISPKVRNRFKYETENSNSQEI